MFYPNMSYPITVAPAAAAKSRALISYRSRHFGQKQNMDQRTQLFAEPASNKPRILNCMDVPSATFWAAL
jgi:hypothetical protein